MGKFPCLHHFRHYGICPGNQQLLAFKKFMTRTNFMPIFIVLGTEQKGYLFGYAISLKKIVLFFTTSVLHNDWAFIKTSYRTLTARTQITIK